MRSSAHVTMLITYTAVAITTRTAGKKNAHSRRRSVQPAITANGAATNVKMFPSGNTLVEISTTSARGEDGLGDITF